MNTPESLSDPVSRQVEVSSHLNNLKSLGGYYGLLADSCNTESTRPILVHQAWREADMRAVCVYLADMNAEPRVCLDMVLDTRGKPALQVANPELGAATHRHTSGRLYRFLGLATADWDESTVAIYQSCAPEDGGRVWVRPESEWLEILGDAREGTHFYRFEPL